MKQDLETLKLEIEDDLARRTFVVFHGRPRSFDSDAPLVEWDTEHHPDFRAFLDTAAKLGVRILVLSYRRFTEAMITDTLDSLEELELPYDERRQYEGRLKELRIYAGFTCAIELSFDFEGRIYLFDLRTEWYDEAMDLIDEINSTLDFAADEEEDGGSYGGYYSRN